MGQPADAGWTDHELPLEQLLAELIDELERFVATLLTLAHPTARESMQADATVNCRNTRVGVIARRR
jgi:hypothetical protein